MQVHNGRSLLALSAFGRLGCATLRATRATCTSTESSGKEEEPGFTLTNANEEVASYFSPGIEEML